MSWDRELKSVIDGVKKGRGAATAVTVDPAIQEGVLTPAIYAMWVDGRVEAPERLQLFTILMSAPVFEGVSPDAFYAMVAKIEQRLGTPVSAKAEEVVRAAVKDLSNGLRETAYAYAVRMIFIDRQIHVSEMQAIDDLSVWLQVGASKDKIRDVMRIMANPPTAA